MTEKEQTVTDLLKEYGVEAGEEEPPIKGGLGTGEKYAIKEIVNRHMFKHKKIILDEDDLLVSGPVAELVLSKLEKAKNWSDEEKRVYWTQGVRGTVRNALSQKRCNVSNTMKARFTGA